MLAILVQSARDDNIRRNAIEALAPYNWADPEHRIFFECIAELHRLDSNSLRAQLPAHLTRKGFPAINLQPYFAPHHLTAAMARAQIRRLLKRVR
ncbi:MAG: hypothetical protein ACRD50_08725 [Candidatus Acidiferrales bacterium]